MIAKYIAELVRKGVVLFVLLCSLLLHGARRRLWAAPLVKAISLLGFKSFEVVSNCPV